MCQGMYAAEMGPPWIKFDERSKAFKILYIEEGIDTIFKQQWAEHETWFTKQSTLADERGALAVTDAAAGSAPGANSTGGALPPRQTRGATAAQSTLNAGTD